MIKDKFFGRKNYLDILEKRICDLKDGYRQNIAIIGDEMVGKTSIIFKLLDKFYDTRIVFIYLEIRPESLESFARRFIGVLLYNFLNPAGPPLEEDINYLAKKSQRYIPKTVEKINLILNAVEKRKKNNVFTDLLSLCDIFYQETSKFCVVIFDEFHNLENMGVKNLYREWSKLLVSQKNTMYLIISSLKFKAKMILSKNLSLLFGNFEVVVVEPFDIKTSGQYLENNLGALGLSIGLKNFILHFTGGYPLYLEVIAESMLKSQQVSLSDILENLLFDSSGTLNQRFSNYLKRFLDMPKSKDYINILHLISSGRNKLKDIARTLKMQKKELVLRTNRLMELDTVTHNGDFLNINDRVFSFWLRFVYQEKQRALTFDAKNQKEFFRAQIENEIQAFLRAGQSTFTERMSELLNLFENETIQIEKKRIRLNHFREIKPLDFGNKGIKHGLIARSSDSLWILAFKREPLTEEDIAEFSKECRRYRHKLQRKIIITPQDIDPNTRLRALEEKVWAWDISKFNQILDLFSKPRVIV